MELNSPWALLLLVILPFLVYLTLRRRPTAAVKFPSLREIKNGPVSLRQRLRPVLLAARLGCVAFLIFSLARPRKGTVLSRVSTEGVAIEAVVDCSGSMKTEMDYYGEKLNRLEVVKRVLSDFIKGDKENFTGRENDLVGLVSFARYSDTKCPLVLGHGVLLEMLKKTDIVRLESENATAIGDAIALGAARLKNVEQEIHQRKARFGLEPNSPAGSGTNTYEIKSKIIILLTDGRNNAGEYIPLQAAGLAKKWGIKIYTIGIGSARSFHTVETPMGSFKLPTGQQLNEGLLKRIAADTGGFYGRADDAKALRKIVEKIDELEKTKVESVKYTRYAERFAPWTMAALVLLVTEMVAGSTVFRKIP